MVQRRGDLRSPRARFLRRQRRRHRRLSRPYRKARLSPGPRRHGALAVALLSVAVARRRLRHRRLHSIHPDYGTLHDFKHFLREAHERGIRVITELVVNHTSDQHPWFQRARDAKPGSSARNFYVWSDNQDKYQEARIIFKDFELSNWSWDPVAKAYFWHRFYSHQPDLNFDNPEVKSALSCLGFLAGYGRRRPAFGCGALSLRARGNQL